MPTSPPIPTSPVKPRRRRVRLNTCDQVRRELARLYRESRDGEREPAAASHLASVLSLIGRLVGANDRPVPAQGSDR